MMKLMMASLPAFFAALPLKGTLKQVAEVCEVGSERRQKNIVLSEAYIDYNIDCLSNENYSVLFKRELKGPIPKPLTLSFRLTEGVHSSPYRKKQLYKSITGYVLQKIIARELNQRMKGFRLAEKYITLYLYSSRQQRFFLVPGNRLEEKLSYWDKKYRNREQLKNYRYAISYFPALRALA